MTDAQPRQTSDDHSAAKRKRLIARLIVFALLFAFALLKPKVDAWLAANPLPGTEQAEPTVWDDSPVTDFADDDVAPETPAAQIDSTDSVADAADVAVATTASPKASDLSNRKSSTDAGQQPSTKASADSTSPQATQTATAPGSQSPASKSQSGTSSKAAAKDDRSNPKTKSTSSTATSSKDDRSNPSRNSDASPSKRSTATSAAESRPAKDPPGKLSLVAGTRDEFRSTAGLVYSRGSEDGHRLKHVLKHAEDNLDKPVHGVFDGDREQILAWIDIAYTKGKQGGKGVRVEKQGGRVVYTVDLGEKIGVVGGQVGDRKGNPPCRFLRLVVQNGNEVVTAYPSQSL